MKSIIKMFEIKKAPSMEQVKTLAVFMINEGDAPDKDSIGIALSAVLYRNNSPLVPSDVEKFLAPLSETETDNWKQKYEHRLFNYTLVWHYDQVLKKYVISLLEKHIGVDINPIN